MQELAAENGTVTGTCVQAELDCPGKFNPNAFAHCSQAALGCGGGGCGGERTCFESTPELVNGNAKFKVCCFVHAKCEGNDILLGGGRRRRRIKHENCKLYDFGL